MAICPPCPPAQALQPGVEFIFCMPRERGTWGDQGTLCSSQPGCAPVLCCVELSPAVGGAGLRLAPGASSALFCSFFFCVCGKIYINNLILFECLIWWPPLHLKCCATITTISTTFSSPKQKLCTHSTKTPHISPAQSLVTSIYFVSPWIGLFQIFQISEIIQYLFFLSGSRHSAWCVHSSATL